MCLPARPESLDELQEHLLEIFPAAGAVAGIGQDQRHNLNSREHGTDIISRIMLETTGVDGK